MTDKLTRRELSATLFGNEKMVEVVLALAGHAPATGKSFPTPRVSDIPWSETF